MPEQFALPVCLRYSLLTLGYYFMTDKIKPLHVPGNFDANASFQDRVVFTLAYLGSAGTEEITAGLISRDAKHKDEYSSEKVSALLDQLYDAGLINGEKEGQKVTYNLSKITRPNTGKVNPADLNF